MASRRKGQANRVNETAQKRRIARAFHRISVAQTPQVHPLLLQRAIANPGRAAPASILALQHTYGNRAVTHLIQTKLTVGTVGDKYEQEADRVAEQAMSTPAPLSSQQPGGGAKHQAGDAEALQAKPLATSITPLVPCISAGLTQRQGVPEEEVHTKPHQGADGSFLASPSLEERLASHKGGGSLLREETRAFMEPRFGADFSGVRVHADGEATQLNRGLNSKAFTHGQDIYFRSENYSPETPPGQKLLAHELAHTLQQGAANRIQGW